MSRCSGKSIRSRLRVITALIAPEGSQRILHLSQSAFLAAHNKRAVATYLDGLGLSHECEHSFNAISFKPTGRIVYFDVEDVKRWGNDGIPSGLARPGDTIERDIP